MSTGTIKFFNAAKGFGFVTPDGGGAELFLPAAAVTAAGVTAIKSGQRISFEQAPDTRGPKVVSLKLVVDTSPKISESVAGQVTVYCDANADRTADVVEAIRGSGFSLTMKDYITAPPTIDQLKRLSQMLSVFGQSLVRRYDPLFLGLQLDDRFITDQDFWTAIVEHPVLINGPVLVASGKARICKAASEVRAFLRKDEAASVPKPKMLPPRIFAMLRGDAMPSVELATPAEPLALPPPAAEPSAKNTTRATTKITTKSKSQTKPKGKTPPKPTQGKTPTKKTAPKSAVKLPKKPKKHGKK